MFKKISIMFLSLMLIFSVMSVSPLTSFGKFAEASSPFGEVGEISPFSNTVGGGGGSSLYKPYTISSTKTVRTNPQEFPADIALAFVGLGGVYKLYQIPTSLNRFLAWAGLSSTIVSRTSTTTYNVTMYKHMLKKPTSTSAGYYQYRIRNNTTGKVEFTKTYNIGKNGI